MDKGLNINIHIIFSFIAAFLAMIFFVFKPLHIKEQSFKDVPVFELKSFMIYEIDSLGLESILAGTHGTRYVDRYKIKDVNFTDNSKKYIANIKANDGTYKDDIITLHKDVVYHREDGLRFFSDEAIYDKRTSIVKTDKKYLAYRENNRLTGTSLVYDNLKNRMKSNNITAIYKLREN